MRELLGRESLVVKKKSNKSKKGYTEVDLIPLWGLCMNRRFWRWRIRR